jgi:hypothetical protein
MQETGLTMSQEYLDLNAIDGVMAHSVAQGCIEDGDAVMRDKIVE